MLSKNKVCAIILALFCFIGTNAQGQEQTVDARTKDQLKVIMAHLLDTIYVSPEIGKQLASQLQSKFESGAYKDVATPSQLAQVLTRDLREMSKDPHLSVTYAPGTGVSETILTPQEWEIRRASMFPSSANRQPGNTPSGGPELNARMANQLLEANYHFRDAKYLSGNIGYLKLDGFAPGQAARDTAAKTMALLANSDAMIIDLRRCPGGSSEMVNFLASYFFEKEPRVLMNRYFRPTGETVQSKTIADIPGKRMLDTDLYLLVSANTVSACESFAYTLQQYERAKVIGERTAGAGYNNVFIPLGLGYSFSVSIGRPVHPRSGKGWQTEGVQPDMVVTPNDALETAHREALQKLISRTTDQNRKKELMSALQNVASNRATANPVASALGAQDYQAYVGKYGNKEIGVKDGGLYYQRIGGGGAALRATGKDKFALKTDAQITFVRDANNVVTEMIIEWVERDKERLKREAPALAPPQAASPGSNEAAADVITKELNAYLEQAAANDAFSGAVLIARDGQPIFKKAYGMANKSSSTPNNVDTKFDLGSMNKMFTAVAIAQLVERGKLSFTDTVGKLLPDYPNKAVAEKVTVHHLLTHTSGLGNYQNETYLANLNNMKTVADLLPLFANEPLAFEPGAKLVYSNSGFVVLGLIIERVSGQNYFDYVREHIFKPAGMANTDSYEKGQNVSNMAVGYMRMNDKGMPDPSVPLRENTSVRPAKGSPAGGGYSTVEDMLRFSLALRGNKLLSKKYTDIVTTGKVEVAGPDRKYAYGFGDNVIDGRHIVGHNGGGPGIGANFDMFPQLGYTAVILSNFSPPAMMPVVKKLRDLIPADSSVAPQASIVPKQGQTLSQSEQEVRKLEREWLDAYEQHDAEAMNRILADDFKLMRSGGAVQTKADILAELKAMRDAGRPAPKFSTEDVQSRVEGDTVILTGRFIQRMERDGQTRTMEARYTDTYVKRQGRWQVVASQLTRIPQ